MSTKLMLIIFHLSVVVGIYVDKYIEKAPKIKLLHTLDRHFSTVHKIYVIHKLYSPTSRLLYSKI